MVSCQMKSGNIYSNSVLLQEDNYNNFMYMKESSIFI